MNINIQHFPCLVKSQNCIIKKNTMKIAILGGSFDPPHNGHVKIAESVILKLGFDQVWLMPCFAHAFGKNLADAKDRFSMAALLETKTIQVSDYEIRKGGISISYETLTDLIELHPHHSFSWIIGSDQIADFPKWEGWQYIIQKFGLIIVARDKKENMEKKTKDLLQLQTLQGITFLQSDDIPNISSTEIRERVKKEEPITDLAPEKVEEYIKNHKLYR